MANPRLFVDRSFLVLLLAVPAAVFAVVFVVSVLYFRASDERTPPRASTASGPVAAAPGSGRLLLTLSAETAEPAESYLVTAGLDGSGVRMITKAPAGGLASDGYPALSPDGRTIAFKRATAAANRSTSPHVYLVEMDGSGLRRVTSGRAAELNPAWSPDGTRIAFARQVGKQFDLFACAPDGSGLMRLTRTPNADEDFPAWSPDGELLAFARYEGGFEGESGDIWLVQPSTHKETLLLGGPGDHAGPAWSPDGKRIAFVEEGHIAVMTANGTDVRPLTGSELKDVRPAWSPDGQRIVFTRDPGTILVMNPDGSDVSAVPLDAPASEAVWVPAA